MSVVCTKKSCAETLPTIHFTLVVTLSIGFMAILRIVNNNHNIFHSKHWTLQQMDVLCLRTHSPAYCWHVLTCFLSICGSFVCLTTSLEGGADGWYVPCGFIAKQMGNHWGDTVSVMCVREGERKKERERHKDVTICLWNYDAQVVSCDGCFTVSLPWRGSLVSKECFSSDWLSGWSSSLMFFSSAFCLTFFTAFLFFVSISWNRLH